MHITDEGGIPPLPADYDSAWALLSSLTLILSSQRRISDFTKWPLRKNRSWRSSENLTKTD